MNHERVSGVSVVNPELEIAPGAINVAEIDACSYLDCGADFASLSGSALLASSSTDTSDVRSNCDSGFSSAYSIGGTTSTYTVDRHYSAGSCTEDLEAQLNLNSGSPGAGGDIPATPAGNFGYLHLQPNEVHTFCPGAATIATPPMTENGEEIEPWILALAGKNIMPDSPGLVEHSAQSIFRAFRTWPRMLAKGIQLPPIIHPLQFCISEGEAGDEMKMPKLIGRCVTLCKMWVGQAEDSGQVVESAVRGEVENILAKHYSYDAPTLLSAIQSLTILLVLLIFPSNRQSTLSIVPAHIFAAVQEVGNHVLSTGMLLHEEANHVRPTWRVWAHIEAKRRTLMSIYFLHWAYSTYHGARHFNCLTLGRVLAPGPKWLWQSTDEKMWMKLYVRWLAQWDGKELIQAEFFLVERGPVMESRVERWLEDADELGLLIMTMLNASQRDLSKIPGAAANIVG
ncbi:hypothetical protein F5B22DRAFT_50341 [Xylaria bambusicola]|uniref:uncharacterized protein n=1 Tax=Xylaria bambusicola TaxID=326684 RepID=UPI0020075B1B|nr:uncharacterized protein F5B22DRAFT_50341 [Xylaria bambusicola]KAI0520742.1 hypothetical protein F5B22DRAFT_50341 [Xylaria bambusicola]